MAIHDDCCGRRAGGADFSRVILLFSFLIFYLGSTCPLMTDVQPADTDVLVAAAAAADAVGPLLLPAKEGQQETTPVPETGLVGATATESNSLMENEMQVTKSNVDENQDEKEAGDRALPSQEDNAKENDNDQENETQKQQQQQQLEKELGEYEDREHEQELRALLDDLEEGEIGAGGAGGVESAEIAKEIVTRVERSLEKRSSRLIGEREKTDKEEGAVFETLTSTAAHRMYEILGLALPKPQPPGPRLPSTRMSSRYPPLSPPRYSSRYRSRSRSPSSSSYRYRSRSRSPPSSSYRSHSRSRSRSPTSSSRRWISDKYQEISSERSNPFKDFISEVTLAGERMTSNSKSNSKSDSNIVTAKKKKSPMDNEKENGGNMNANKLNESDNEKIYVIELENEVQSQLNLTRSLEQHEAIEPLLSLSSHHSSDHIASTDAFSSQGGSLTNVALIDRNVAAEADKGIHNSNQISSLDGSSLQAVTNATIIANANPTSSENTSSFPSPEALQSNQNDSQVAPVLTSITMLSPMLHQPWPPRPSMTSENASQPSKISIPVHVTTSLAADSRLPIALAAELSPGADAQTEYAAVLSHSVEPMLVTVSGSSLIQPINANMVAAGLKLSGIAASISSSSDSLQFSPARPLSSEPSSLLFSTSRLSSPSSELPSERSTPLPQPQTLTSHSPIMLSHPPEMLIPMTASGFAPGSFIPLPPPSTPLILSSMSLISSPVNGVFQVNDEDMVPRLTHAYNEDIINIEEMRSSAKDGSSFSFMSQPVETFNFLVPHAVHHSMAASDMFHHKASRPRTEVIEVDDGDVSPASAVSLVDERSNRNQRKQFIDITTSPERDGSSASKKSRRKKARRNSLITEVRSDHGNVTQGGQDVIETTNNRKTHHVNSSAKVRPTGHTSSMLFLPSTSSSSSPAPFSDLVTRKSLSPLKATRPLFTNAANHKQDSQNSISYASSMRTHSLSPRRPSAGMEHQISSAHLIREDMIHFRNGRNDAVHDRGISHFKKTIREDVPPASNMGALSSSSGPYLRANGIVTKTHLAPLDKRIEAYYNSSNSPVSVNGFQRHDATAKITTTNFIHPSRQAVIDQYEAQHAAGPSLPSKTLDSIPILPKNLTPSMPSQPANVFLPSTASHHRSFSPMPEEMNEKKRNRSRSPIRSKNVVTARSRSPIRSRDIVKARSRSPIRCKVIARTRSRSSGRSRNGMARGRSRSRSLNRMARGRSRSRGPNRNMMKRSRSRSLNRMVRGRSRSPSRNRIVRGRSRSRSRGKSRTRNGSRTRARDGEFDHNLVRKLPPPIASTLLSSSSSSSNTSSSSASYAVNPFSFPDRSNEDQSSNQGFMKTSGPGISFPSPPAPLSLPPKTSNAPGSPSLPPSLIMNLRPPPPLIGFAKKESSLASKEK